MVCTIGWPGWPPGEMVVAMRVSLTDVTDTLMSTGTGRSMRLKTMPVSGAAGRSVSSTFWPLCTPRPTARVIDFKVRCASIPHCRRMCPRRRRGRALWPNTRVRFNVNESFSWATRSRPKPTARPPRARPPHRRDRDDTQGPEASAWNAVRTRAARRTRASAPRRAADAQRAAAARHCRTARRRKTLGTAGAPADAANHRTAPAAGPRRRPRCARRCCARLGLADAELGSLTVFRRAWDARKKSAVVLSLHRRLRAGRRHRRSGRAGAAGRRPRTSRRSPDTRYRFVGHAPADFYGRAAAAPGGRRLRAVRHLRRAGAGADGPAADRAGARQGRCASAPRTPGACGAAACSTRSRTCSSAKAAPAPSPTASCRARSATRAT